MALFVCKNLSNWRKVVYKMLDKYIFNLNNTEFVGDIIKARDTAINKGFEFFQFNNTIYFIDNKKNIHKTNMFI